MVESWVLTVCKLKMQAFLDMGWGWLDEERSLTLTIRLFTGFYAIGSGNVMLKKIS